jgi:hypothetical protein
LGNRASWLILNLVSLAHLFGQCVQIKLRPDGWSRFRQAHLAEAGNGKIAPGLLIAADYEY